MLYFLRWPSIKSLCMALANRGDSLRVVFTSQVPQTDITSPPRTWESRASPRMVPRKQNLGLLGTTFVVLNILGGISAERFFAQMILFELRNFSRKMLRNFPESLGLYLVGPQNSCQTSRIISRQTKITDELLQKRREKNFSVCPENLTRCTKHFGESVSGVVDFFRGGLGERGEGLLAQIARRRTPTRPKR